MMKWMALHFETTHDNAELLADLLASSGAAGVQTEDVADLRSILADPSASAYADDTYVDSLDPAVQITAYFALCGTGVRCCPDPELGSSGLYAESEMTVVPVNELERMLQGHLDRFAAYLPIGRGYIGHEEIREEDWANNWKIYYDTLHLTGRLVINPSWIDYRPSGGEVVITLDPGSAFGTGVHETTAMCAELLDERLLPGSSVLDLGTGSGILAIIAAKLGAGFIEAIDIDPMAVNVAKANAAINKAKVICRQGELKDAENAPYDMIIANIIADVIVKIAADVPRHMAEGGLFIASGIIADKLAAVLDALESASLTLLEQRAKGDWRTAVCMKSK